MIIIIFQIEELIQNNVLSSTQFKSIESGTHIYAIPDELKIEERP